MAININVNEYYVPNNTTDNSYSNSSGSVISGTINTIGNYLQMKTDTNGVQYLFSNLPLVSEGNVIAHSTDGATLPSIFDNLPVSSYTSLGTVQVDSNSPLTITDGLLSFNQSTITKQTLTLSGNDLSISDGNTIDLSSLSPDLSGYATESYVTTTLGDYVTSTNLTTILGDYSTTSHNHSGVYEPTFTKNSAFNKNFGTTSTTVAYGNHLHTGTYHPLLGNTSTSFSASQLAIKSGVFTYDAVNEEIVLNKNIRIQGNVYGEGNVVAFADGGSVGSIWGDAPIASTTSLGMMQVGSGLNVANGIVSVNSNAINPTLSFSNNILSVNSSAVDLSALSIDSYTKSESDGRYSLSTHNHTGTYALIGGSGTQNFAVKDLTAVNLNVTGTITQVDTQIVKSTNDLIITRDGATTGLIAGTYTGIQATNYDGNDNDGQLVFGSDGFARVGDVDDLQILATREDSPLSNGIAYFDNTTKQFKTKTESSLSVSYASNADKLDGLHASSFMRTSSFNGYYGLVDAAGSATNWIRTTQSGLIPYASGGDVSQIGTPSWNFNSIYGKTIYENNVSLASKYARKGSAETITGSWTFQNDLNIIPGGDKGIVVNAGFTLKANATGGTTQLLYYNSNTVYYGRNIGGGTSIQAHKFRTQGLDRLQIQSDGKVKIGAGAATEALDVVGNMQGNGFIRATTSNPNATNFVGKGLELFFSTSSDRGFIQAYDRTGGEGYKPIVFDASAFNFGNGNVKIGSSSEAPSEALDVVGNIKATGFVKSTSYQTDNGGGAMGRNGTVIQIAKSGINTGGVELYHNNAVKLKTNSTGVDVTGDLTASHDVKTGSSGEVTGNVHTGTISF